MLFMAQVIAKELKVKISSGARGEREEGQAYSETYQLCEDSTVSDTVKGVVATKHQTQFRSPARSVENCVHDRKYWEETTIFF